MTRERTPVHITGLVTQATGTALGDIVAIARNVTGDPLSPTAEGIYALDRVAGIDRRNGTRVIESTRTVPAGTLALARGTYPETFRDGRPHTWALTLPGVSRAGLWRRYRADGMPEWSTLEDAREYVRPFRVRAR